FPRLFVNKIDNVSRHILFRITPMRPVEHVSQTQPRLTHQKHEPSQCPQSSPQRMISRSSVPYRCHRLHLVHRAYLNTLVGKFVSRYPLPIRDHCLQRLEHTRLLRVSLSHGSCADLWVSSPWP